MHLRCLYACAFCIKDRLVSTGYTKNMNKTKNKIIMPESLQTQLENLHTLFSDTALADPKLRDNYVWTTVKQINMNISEIPSVLCRKLLADCMKLPIQRPSNLYSALLSAAVKTSTTYSEFRFAVFLKMWGLQNIRQEDKARQQSNGKSFPSLLERVAKALAHTFALHSQDRIMATDSDFSALLTDHGLSVKSMLVTRIKEAIGKDGRKYIFVTLSTPDGFVVEAISKKLQAHPLFPLPAGKRHYVNLGQLYDCVVGPGETLMDAYLSQSSRKECFPEEIGFVESIDVSHGHMHIYDRHSRHFVAPIQRFSKEKAGDFVRFVPIIPQSSKFKTAIIVGSLSSSSEEARSMFRAINVTAINSERGFACWELLDKEHPIRERLSPFQISQGEVSPEHTSGFLRRTDGVGVGKYSALIYLKRGKDGVKRPHVAVLSQYA